MEKPLHGLSIPEPGNIVEQMSTPEGSFFDVTDVLDLNFHVTWSGRVFSPWEAVVIGGNSSAAFDIATAVSLAVEEQGEEDLAEADSAQPAGYRVVDRAVSVSMSSSSSASSSSRKARDKAGSKLRRDRARKSAKVKAQVNFLPPPCRPEHVKLSSKPVSTKFQLMKQQVASTGWIGLRDDGRSTQEEEAGIWEAGWTPTHYLPDFFGPTPEFVGFKLIKYLGLKTRPILDSTDKIFGLFAGHPDDPDWMARVHDPAVQAMEEASANCAVSEARTFHRHGNFYGLTSGNSYGGGQTEPGTLVNGVINTAVLCCLLSNVTFIWIAGFATGVFANWAPNLFEYYVIHMRRFYRRYAHLKQLFLNGIWSACTFNLGPQTCALGHRDFANLAFGWCAITALGNFDYTKGGHLILWDCKLILEFPPGTTVLIPSAALFHSNIPIGERRYSFTQYTAGGYSAERAREREEAKTRWQMGAGLFSTLDELKST
ncbi:hypothetical protein B0H13DRAFT_2568122 [Mycena leptocephala]|nr:hypothetical protein B0H13DRAFT_2568122 [Mycena leptocephala]